MHVKKQRLVDHSASCDMDMAATGPEWGSVRARSTLLAALIIIIIILSFFRRHFKLDFDPLNILENSPKLVRMSGLVKNFI